MKMTKLKPCPFCGGMRPRACICAQRWAVRCPECGAMVMSDSADDGGKSAAKRWNARASEEDRRTVRTCHVEHIDDDSFHLSCGHEAAGCVSPSFCPCCGAKVVEAHER